MDQRRDTAALCARIVSACRRARRQTAARQGGKFHVRSLRQRGAGRRLRRKIRRRTRRQDRGRESRAYVLRTHGRGARSHLSAQIFQKPVQHAVGDSDVVRRKGAAAGGTPRHRSRMPRRTARVAQGTCGEAGRTVLRLAAYRGQISVQTPIRQDAIRLRRGARGAYRKNGGKRDGKTARKAVRSRAGGVRVAQALPPHHGGNGRREHCQSRQISLYIR